MDELLIGTLLPGAVAVYRQNINPVWRGNVLLGSYRRQMYVKHVEQRTLVVEVLCSVVGRALGLPIPRPALVQVKAGTLHEVQAPLVFFGCEAVDSPDLKQSLNRDGDEPLQQLAKWAQLLDAGCFDEWTANTDRHGGNILYGGGKNFALIDHSEALPRHLSPPDPAAENKLLTYAAHGKAGAALDDLYSAAKASCHPFAALSVQAELLETLAGVSDQATVEGLVAFLHQRIHSLLVLISRRIGHTQTAMVLSK